MRAMLLVLVLTLMAGCQRARVEHRCPCGDVSAEVAFAIALQAMTLIRSERMPDLRLPNEVELVASYGFAPTAMISVDEATRGAVIEFDRPQLEMLARELGPGAAIGIFAHELSHAHHVFTRQVNMSDHERELSADAIAGCALAVIGCQLSGWVAFLNSTTGGTGHSHPAAFERIESAQRAYDSCANTD